MTARALALKTDRPRYTASAPFSTAAFSWGQPPAGASTWGFLKHVAGASNNAAVTFASAMALLDRVDSVADALMESDDVLDPRG